MIDIHIHSNYSDGDNTLENILKICEEKKLEYISITDHNTCRQYEDEVLKNNNIFSGKIIKGAETDATFQGKKIELLAYNIKEPKIINDWSKRFFSEEILKAQQEESKKKILNICDEKGLIYDESKIPQDIPITDYISIYIYKELMNHKENYEILGEYAQSVEVFIRKGLLNPESYFYMSEENTPKPMYKDVVDIIHESGGLAFLAHPFEYRFNDTICFINELRREKELDGIECFHPSSEEDNKYKILLEYTKDNNLYISGGSDYHGKKKKGIEIGTGKGTLEIPKEIIENWDNY